MSGRQSHPGPADEKVAIVFRDGSAQFSFQPRESHRHASNSEDLVCLFATAGRAPLPHGADPRSYRHGKGTTYPDMHWEPKQSFRAVADYYVSQP